MSYENYKLEDFLTDDEFKKWVLNPDNNAHLFWGKWIDSHPGQKEIILQARELILSYRFKEAEVVSNEEQEDILGAILRKSGSRVHYTSFNYKRLRYAVAACIAFVIMAVGLFIYDKDQVRQPFIPLVVKENPKGQKSRIRLPDGTIVWLNSDSRLTFPEQFNHERTVELQGEAYFEVTEDPYKPFSVTSQGIVTTALGTSFNIKAYKEQAEIEVLLVSGKVSVERTEERNHQPEKIFVSPGEQVTYNIRDEVLQKTTATDKRAILWKDGIISFQRAGFDQIKTKLERWYGVSIQARDLDRKLHYTADFDNTSLERVLERMAFTERFTFEIRNDTIKIDFE